jgi:hypothetical protein
LSGDTGSIFLSENTSKIIHKQDQINTIFLSGNTLENYQASPLDDYHW